MAYGAADRYDPGLSGKSTKYEESMSRIQKLKVGFRNLWVTLKWLLFLFLSAKVLLQFGADGRFHDGWVFNLLPALIAILLMAPALYGRKINKDGKPGFLAKLTTRFFLAFLMLLLPIFDIGGSIDKRYKAYVAYQKLSPEEKITFNLAELKREQEEAMARKIAASDAKSRSNEAARLAEIAKTSASEPIVEPTSYNGCVSKGISYFREIGSYPRLTTGELATEEARERCQRTRGAFDL